MDSVTHELKFSYDQETKNCHRYKEQNIDGRPPKVGTLYVQKWAIPDVPTELVVTIKGVNHA